MRQLTIWSSVVVGAGVIACAGKTFVRADPPIATQGISIALVDETCALDSDPEQGGTFLLDLGLTLRLTDGAGAPVSFHPDRARLVFAGRETVSDDRPSRSASAPDRRRTCASTSSRRGGTSAATTS